MNIFIKSYTSNVCWCWWNKTVEIGSLYHCVYSICVLCMCVCVCAKEWKSHNAIDITKRAFDFIFLFFFFVVHSSPFLSSSICHSVLFTNLLYWMLLLLVAVDEGNLCVMSWWYITCYIVQWRISDTNKAFFKPNGWIQMNSNNNERKWSKKTKKQKWNKTKKSDRKLQFTQEKFNAQTKR